MGEWVAKDDSEVYHVVRPFVDLTACGKPASLRYRAHRREALLVTLEGLEAGFRRRPCKVCASTKWWEGA